jgi:ribosomal protein S18 acetylase RimI-like enzyme
MRLALTVQTPSGSWRPRSIRAADAEAIGALMLAAYRGTADDEGESESDAVAEVKRTMDGDYGLFLPDCSFVVEDDEGRLVGASMVTIFESEPVITYVMVHPGIRRRGLGTFLMVSSRNALGTAGYTQVDLFVTEANEPAVSLYRKLGFEVVDRITGPG